MNQKIAVNARTMNGFIKRLHGVKILLHNEGKENLAAKVHELQQDCLFDNYLELSRAKHRLVRILS